MYILPPSISKKIEGYRWQSFTPPAAGKSRRFRGTNLSTAVLTRLHTRLSERLAEVRWWQQDASRIGGVGLLIIRDWVLRSTPADWTGWDGNDESTPITAAH